jgi:hypothetical protein
LNDEVDPRCATLTIVHGLKVIDQCQNILMSHRNPLQYCNLIAHHVLSPGHQPLVDDLGSEIATGIDVDAFLDDTV